MDFTKDELSAIEKALPAIGQHVATAGFGGKSFNDLSRDEVLGLVANTVRAFRAQLDEMFGDIPF